MFIDVIDILFLGALALPLLNQLGIRIGVKKLRETIAVLVLILSMYLVYTLYLSIQIGIQILPLPFTPFGSCFEIDMLSVFMAAVFIFIGLMSAIFSVRYMEHDTGLTEYYTALILIVAGMVGLAFAGDFFSFFIFWELMCISSYVLVAFRKERWEPVEAGFKYLIMSSAGSALLLLAMSLLYGMTGTLNFAGLTYAMRSAPQSSNPWLLVTLALIISGFGVKAAIVPYHTWLPDAHPAAPSPVSSILSGVMIKTGVYGLVRILILVFAPVEAIWQLSLTSLAVLTMFVGNLMALVQTDLKRLLAFSSIAQIGYIIFGFSLGTISGLTGSMLHVLNHAVMKGLLFMCSGSFLHASGTRDLLILRGIGRKMPVSGAVFTVACLAITGVPTLNGFVSELYIIMAGIEASMYLPTALMVVNIAISAAYYIRIIQITMLREPSEKLAGVHEVPISMMTPMLILVSLCLIIGLFPGPFIELAQKAAHAALNTADYVKPFIRG